MTLKSRHLLYSFLAVLSFSSALPGLAGDVYLSIRGDGGGSGTQGDPYDASSPDKFDGILTRFTSNTNFHYAPGTYQTHGYSFQQRETAHAGCRHYGAGVDKTVIQLAQGSLIFGGDWNHFLNGFEVHDLTLDCNAQGNPVFQNHQGAVAAFSGNGNDILLQHLKVINFGTGRQGSEDFVMFVDPPSAFQGQTFNNIVYDSIEFSHPASGNADGTSIAGINSPQGITVNGKIINCQFIDCKSDFSFSNCFNATDCENNYVQNGDNGIYFEPRDSHDDTYTFLNNRFVNVHHALYINWHPGAHLGRIIFNGNQLALDTTWVGAAGISINEPTSGASSSISYLEFKNNTVTLSGSGPYASIATALDLRNPFGTYWIGQVVASGNNVSSPARTYNITPGVANNLSAQ